MGVDSSYGSPVKKPVAAAPKPKASVAPKTTSVVNPFIATHAAAVKASAGSFAGNIGTRMLNPDNAIANARATYKAPTGSNRAANKAMREAGFNTSATINQSRFQNDFVAGGNWSSSYMRQEQAARKQLGSLGLARRAAQLPYAAGQTARGFVRELTGIDVSRRRGVKVDPVAVAMSFPIGKMAKFGKIALALRESQFGGKVVRALNQGSQSVIRSAEGAFEATADRLAAAEYGKEISKLMAKSGLKSLPNNTPGLGRGGRDVFRSVRESIPARPEAQKIRQFGGNPEAMYPSGVTAGGYLKAPNLRTRTPAPPTYLHNQPGSEVIESGLSPAQHEARAKIAELLNEATIRRNLSAGMKPGGEYYFPREWQVYTHGTIAGGKISIDTGRLDPVTYATKVMEMLRKKAIDASKRRLK